MSPQDPSGLFDLSGRTALVTGARRGIGRAMATALAEAGADIVAVSAAMSEHDDVVAEIRALGRNVTCLRVDLSDRQAVDALVDDLRRASIEVDVLVNNAGIIERAPFLEHADTAWDAVLETNLASPFRLSRGLAAGMVERRRGKIIFTASLLSFQGGINVTSYAAAKSGLAGVVRAMSNELSGYGVNVNGIVPGYIRTDNTIALQKDPARHDAILERIPAGRWGEPGDLSGATVFLASQASNYVDGVLLPIDGGWLGR